MFKAVFYFALLIFCSAWSIPNQQESVNYQSQLPSFGPQQNDENEVVDNLGGGYSFFRHQVISPRPLAQQTFPTIETQAVDRMSGDTSNQWSDYKRSSAFMDQPSVGLVAPKAHANGYNQPQFEQPKVFATGYEQQPQPDFGDVVSDDSYSQQGLGIAPAPRIIDSGYGQKRTTVASAPRVIDTGYGEQSQPNFGDIVSDDSYGQPGPSIAPAPRIIDSGYGQQQTLIAPAPRLVPTGCRHRSNPAVGVTSDDSYGHQRPSIAPVPRIIESGYGQKRTLIAAVPRVIDTGYGQQSKPDFGDFVSDDSYGQQRPTIAPAPRIIDSGYGQQRTLIAPAPRVINSGYSQQRTLIAAAPRVIDTGYGQQRKPDFGDVISDDSYGQQRPTIAPAPRMIESGYGQQRTLIAAVPRLGSTGCRHRSNPAVGGTSDVSYGQQRAAVALAPKMIAGGYEQQRQVQEFSSFEAAGSNDGTQPNIAPGSFSSYSSFEIPAQRSLFVPRAKLSVQSNGY